jgi:hypothetical protein
MERNVIFCCWSRKTTSTQCTQLTAQLFDNFNTVHTTNSPALRQLQHSAHNWQPSASTTTSTQCTRLTAQLFDNNFHTVHTTGSQALPDHSRQYQRCTSYAAVHYIVLLTMGILMAETCWDKGRWMNFLCVASSWTSTVPSFTMHCHMNVTVLKWSSVSLDSVVLDGYS